LVRKEDDGPGGANPARGSGLIGLRDRSPLPGDGVDAGQIKAGKPGVSSSAAAVQADWTQYWNDPSQVIAIAGRLRPVSRSPGAAPLPRR